MPPFLWVQDAVSLSYSLGLHELGLLSHSRGLIGLAAVGVCSRAGGVREERESMQYPRPHPATCSSCHPPLLPKAGPPIGLSHIRQWLAAKPHNPQRHKSSTMCLNKRAAVEAVPRGCGAGMSFFRCRGPFIKTSVSFGSKINQYSHPFMAQGKAFHNLCFGQPWLLEDNQSAGSKGSCPTQGLSPPNPQG